MSEYQNLLILLHLSESIYVPAGCETTERYRTFNLTS